MGASTIDLPSRGALTWPRVSVAGLRRHLPVLVPSVVAFVITVWNVGRKSMYGTEAVTTWAAHLPLPRLAHVLAHVDAVHGTYYVVMHVVFLLGSGTFWMRLPSVLAMTAAAGLTALLARRLTGSSTAALFAGLALAISPLTTQYGQSGRSYAIDTAAAVLTWSLFLTAVQDETASRRAWWRYTIALAITAYLHEMTLLVIGANLVTLVWARVPRASWLGWLRATAWGVFLSIPIIGVSYIQDRQVSWIPPATFTTVRVLYQNFLGPSTLALTISIGLIVICLVAAVRAERLSPGVTLTRLALPILVVSPMLLIGESMMTKPLYGGIRYVVWALPAMALLVGTGLDVVVRAVFRGRTMAIGVVVGLALLGASLSSNWTLQKLLHTPAGAPQDLLAAASYLHEHAQRGDGVIFMPRSLYAVELGYPHDVTALRDLVLKHSPRASGTLYGSELNGMAITRAVDASSRIWYVGTSPPDTSRAPATVALVHHFHRVSIHSVKGCTISLWQRVS